MIKFTLMVVRLLSGLAVLIAAYQTWVGVTLISGGEDVRLAGYGLEIMANALVIGFAGIGVAILTTLDFSKD